MKTQSQFNRASVKKKSENLKTEVTSNSPQSRKPVNKITSANSVDEKKVVMLTGRSGKSKSPPSTK